MGGNISLLLQTILQARGIYLILQIHISHLLLPWQMKPTLNRLPTSNISVESVSVYNITRVILS